MVGVPSVGVGLGRRVEAGSGSGFEPLMGSGCVGLGVEVGFAPSVVNIVVGAGMGVEVVVGAGVAWSSGTSPGVSAGVRVAAGVGVGAAIVAGGVGEGVGVGAGVGVGVTAASVEEEEVWGSARPMAKVETLVLSAHTNASPSGVFTLA